MLEYYYTHVVVYEAANGEHFRDPDSVDRYFYTLPPLGSGNQRLGSNPPLNSAWVDISAKWMDAAQSLLNAFLAIDIAQVRKLPEIVFSRIFAAITSLLKIYDTARRTALGTIIQPNSLAIGTSIDSVTQKLFLAGLDGHYKVPSRWYHICLKKREWFHGLEAEDLRRCGSPSLFPIQHSVTGMGQAPNLSGTFDFFPITDGWAPGSRNEATAPVYDIVNEAMATTLSTGFPYATSSIMEETHSRLPEFWHGQWH